MICPNSDAPFSVNKRSEVCQPQPSLLVFVLAIEAYDLVLCLALTPPLQLLNGIIIIITVVIIII